MFGECFTISSVVWFGAAAGVAFAVVDLMVRRARDRT
jgi:hypothetical protein